MITCHWIDSFSFHFDNLQNPSKAIPKGTILAIIITTFSYAVVAIIFAGTTKRTATGYPPDFYGYGQFYNNSSCIPVEETYGSYYDYQVSYTRQCHKRVSSN